MTAPSNTGAGAGAPAPPGGRHAFLAVLVAALGYFVDIYDLLLFAIIRVQSLLDLGVGEADLLVVGADLIAWQMGGMLVGGVLWGVLGDRRGRLSVLFGSIALYSIANIANGLITTVEAYAFWRFVAGVGLAGELGAGVTLVSEVMSKQARGYGAMIISAVGIMGAVVGALIGDLFDWRIAYFVGGGMGIALLILRIGVAESGMFQHVREAGVSRGNFLMFFTSRERLLRYLAVILIGIPMWYIVGILITFAPELGRAMGMVEVPLAGQAVMWCYAGASIGSLICGALSQRWQTRTGVVRLTMVFGAAAIAVFFAFAGTSLTVFYTLSFVLGLSCGYWAVFVLMASELFGTNIRATAATTAPNFVRGSLVLMTAGFSSLTASLGVQMSAIIVGAITLLIAFAALSRLEDTYGKDLDYVER
jgi:putative MFS transporter